VKIGEKKGKKGEKEGGEERTKGERG